MAEGMPAKTRPIHKAETIPTALDSWYRRHARVLPWRVGPEERDAGIAPDPYLVWLSEVMLQQTTIPHAAPYFEKFRKRWPGVKKLAAATGKMCPRRGRGWAITAGRATSMPVQKWWRRQGGFPQDAAGLRELPGVGPYTANAIAAIAYDEPLAPVDGNIERVVSRLWAIGSDGTEAGWRAAKAEIVRNAQSLFDDLPKGVRPGDLAQALMDLGATVCTPKKPNCLICPVSKMCAALKEGAPERYPMKAEKKERPTRHGAAFVLTRGDKVLLVRRGPSGLLGGMMMPPTSEWLEKKPAILGGPFRSPGRCQLEAYRRGPPCLHAFCAEAGGLPGRGAAEVQTPGRMAGARQGACLASDRRPEGRGACAEGVARSP